MPTKHNKTKEIYKQAYYPEVHRLSADNRPIICFSKQNNKKWSEFPWGHKLFILHRPQNTEMGWAGPGRN